MLGNLLSNNVNFKFVFKRLIVIISGDLKTWMSRMGTAVNLQILVTGARKL